MRAGADRATALMIGLAVFAVVFAINSAVHSYLVLAYTDKDRVALDVGFYTWQTPVAAFWVLWPRASCFRFMDSSAACGALRLWF